MRRIVKILTFYDDGSFTETPIPYYNAPMPPYNPIPNACPKCGLKLESAMGYVCSNYPCPVGLGGAWCNNG